jgi:hypothetical protein
MPAPHSRPAAPPLLGPVKPAKLAEQLCTALHALPGQRSAACCATTPSANLYAECVNVVSRALASRSIELDVASVGRCERAMQEQLQGCDWVRPGLPLAPEACQGLIEGRVALGGACRSSLECAGSAHCATSDSATQGRCVPPAAAGAPCGRGTDEMAAYLLDRSVEAQHPGCSDFCSLVSHQCGSTPAEGGACRASVNCAPGQHCVSGVCTAGTGRTALAQTGGSCRTDLDCARGGCIQSAGAGARICGKRCPATPPL